MVTLPFIGIDKSHHLTTTTSQHLYKSHHLTTTTFQHLYKSHHLNTTTYHLTTSTKNTKK
ncbi:MAG: hypothetical protein SOU54_04325 [Prevotella sp.]|nr:hypothetical protein [Prevotella sp.]